VESFLASTSQPALLEEGEEPIVLAKDNYSLEHRSGRLVLSAWDSAHNIARRVVAVDQELPGRLQLRIARLGGKPGRLILYDQRRPRNSGAARRGSRLVTREWFRRFLRRQFPGWRIASLSGDPYLEQSLSPVYPRALVTLGSRGWAVMGAREDSRVDGVLTFGLIWVDYLRRQRPETSIVGLTLLLPDGRHKTTCLRLRHLKQEAARFQVFVHGDDGWEDRVDLDDYGNLDTHLEICHGPDEPIAVASADSAHPLRISQPESWLENQVRADLETLGADLLPAPVYGQVPAFAGGSRGIIDLLAAERTGRLAVLELKATADLHLPLQALDYWMRVQWHAERGEFTERGYFPGHRVTADPPRLMLVAPALEFHSTTETILEYFSPDISVERIGLDANWRRRLRVAFRCGGSRRPGMS